MNKIFYYFSITSGIVIILLSFFVLLLGGADVAISTIVSMLLGVFIIKMGRNLVTRNAQCIFHIKHLTT